MPFAPHYRITALGQFGSGPSEIFSYGLNMEFGSTPIGELVDAGPNQAALDDMADDLAAFHGRAESKISIAAHLTAVKIAHIGADGKYTQDPFIKSFAVNGGVDDRIGATWFVPRPPQVACAVSLNTDLRGPSGKGRFYLPLPAVSVEATNSYRMSVADAESIRGSVKTLLDSLNNNPGFDIFSPSVVVASTKGFNTPVTSVRVGRVLDTIRTRRNKLVESYTADVDLADNET